MSKRIKFLIAVVVPTCLVAAVLVFLKLNAEKSIVEESGVLESSSLSDVEAQNLFERSALNTIASLKSYIEDKRSFNNKNCASDLKKTIKIFRHIKPDFFDFASTKQDFTKILQNSFLLRQSLRSRLRDLTSTTCINEIREALLVIRYFEDYLIITFENPKSFDPKKDPVAGPLLQGKLPALQTLGQGVVKLRSGDLLLSRGNAYTSAAISRIGESPAQFSHLAQIYINAPAGTELTMAQALKDNRVYTVEAHIEVGSFTRSFAKYAQDGNARIAQFRSNLTKEKAHKAAESIFSYVTKYQEKKMKEAGRKKLSANDNPPYDFKMDGKDHEEIFCAEIVSMAYGEVGLKLPKYPTKLKQNVLTQTMEISSPSAFAPADMEVEPRFTQLAEWRDVRKLASIMKKDVALTSMYDWMQNKKYVFHYNASDYVKAQIAWSARQLDLGFSERLPKNMNKKVIRMTFAIDRVGAKLERQLGELEKETLRSGRRFKPTFPEQVIDLEKFRKKDERVFKETGEALFYGIHQTFRP